MDSLRRTKILATLGPSSSSPKMIRQLIEEGADGFRLNLAHGTPEEHEKTVKYVRSLEKNLAVVADIRGSKVRVGNMPKEGILLEKGSSVVIDTSKSEFKKGIIPVPFPLSRSKVKKGGTVYLDDGMIMLKVEKTSGQKIFCEVVREGRLFSRKGVNIPGAMVHPSGVSERDREDILFGKKLGADYISLSFLTSSEDADKARALLEGSNAKIIAKIESHEALENLDDIIESVDAVMIARGDLGLEIPLADVPLQQKEIMKKCQEAGVPVIVATQMLASMINNPTPTRAEVSDVANAVFDVADVVMLSGETASGLYPAEAVRTMRMIIESAEKKSQRNIFHKEGKLPVNVAVAEAACKAAQDVGAKFILVGTRSGFSAKAVAKCRPDVPVIALTEYKYVANQLSLVWGVSTICSPEIKDMESFLNSAMQQLKKEDLLKKGDAIVYVTGIKYGQSGGTNTMRILVV